ncbi:hypothetical protein M231_07986 [Tremella mesenterica]|uniref:Uncharacterized protein n=1 Tax=Tremella mesenterica TaxID=5217 RepID=A0A4Q1BDC3_TREME|nr:hypothetical protein M231_07986 [Tremella mesenterica]
MATQDNLEGRPAGDNSRSRWSTPTISSSSRSPSPPGLCNFLCGCCQSKDSQVRRPTQGVIDEPIRLEIPPTTGMAHQLSVSDPLSTMPSSAEVAGEHLIQYNITSSSSHNSTQGRPWSDSYSVASFGRSDEMGSEESGSRKPARNTLTEMASELRTHYRELPIPEENSPVPSTVDVFVNNDQQHMSPDNSESSGGQVKGGANHTLQKKQSINQLVAAISAGWEGRVMGTPRPCSRLSAMSASESTDC